MILSLSPTQAAAVRLINFYGQATASQVRRALYEGTDRGTAVRASRHLKALSERGTIKRLPYKLSGYQRGSGEYVYSPAESKARIPNLHQLGITEVAVGLREQPLRPVEFYPEPYSHDTWGGVKLKPDFYVKVGKRHFFGEVDFETEFASVLSGKMNAYLRAYYGMDGGSFPKVVFICHTSERARFIQRVIDQKPLKALFEVCLFDDAVGVLTSRPPADKTVDMVSP
jgi:hypothetical protein